MDDTPAEKAETLQRQMRIYFERNWRGVSSDDATEYWVMQRARGTIEDNMVDPDKRPR